MTLYVWTESGFVNKRTGEPMDLPYAGQICAPQIMPDTTEYLSPCGTGLITSRSQRREDLRRNDAVEADPPVKKREYRNPKFALKRSLPLAEDVAASIRETGL